jgi:hypothetical protein
MSLALLLLAALCAAVVTGLLAPGPADAADPLTFGYTPSAPLTGELVTFTSPYDTPQQEWDLDGDGACDDASGPTAQRTFDFAGVYTVRLCVTPDTGPVTFVRSVTVHNRPPVAAFTYAPGTPVAGEAVVFTSTAGDPDGPIMTLNWDLDNDGAFDDATGTSASYTFRAAGVYTVRLAVGDRDGASSVAGATVTVAKPRPKLLAFFPVVRITATVSRRGTRVRSLIVTAPRRSRVIVRCRGRGCAFRRLSRSASSRARAPRARAWATRVIRVRRLRGQLLRPGALLVVRITKPDTIGKYTSFRIRRGKSPLRKDRCLVPGSPKPVRCGST